MFLKEIANMFIIEEVLSKSFMYELHFLNVFFICIKKHHVIDPIHSSTETKHLHVAVVSPFLNWSPPVAVDLYCCPFPRHLFSCGIEVFKMTWSCSTVCPRRLVTAAEMTEVFQWVCVYVCM